MEFSCVPNSFKKLLYGTKSVEVFLRIVNISNHTHTQYVDLSTSAVCHIQKSVQVISSFPPINIEYLFYLCDNNKPHPNLKKLQKKTLLVLSNLYFIYCTNKNSTTVTQMEQHIILLLKYMKELRGAEGANYPHSPFHIAASPLFFASEFPIFP